MVDLTLFEAKLAHRSSSSHSHSALSLSCSHLDVSSGPQGPTGIHFKAVYSFLHADIEHQRTTLTKASLLMFFHCNIWTLLRLDLSILSSIWGFVHMDAIIKVVLLNRLNFSNNWTWNIKMLSPDMTSHGARSRQCNIGSKPLILTGSWRSCNLFPTALNYPCQMVALLQMLSSKALKKNWLCGAAAFPPRDPKLRRHIKPNSQITSMSKASGSKELGGRLWGDSNITYITVCVEINFDLVENVLYSQVETSQQLLIICTVVGFRSTFVSGHQAVCS